MIGTHYVRNTTGNVMEKFFLLILLVGSAFAQELILIAVVSSQVAAGNYSYFSLSYEGRIALYLHSESGDADMYVSQYVTNPTYEPSNYCRQSSTCGLDVVHIPKDFIRPITVGIYGHPSHDWSVYILQVFYRLNDDVFEAASIRYYLEEEDDSRNLYEYSQKKVAYTERHEGDDGEQDISTWALVWSLFTIVLDVIFV
ncbi:UPF0669 protein C6orf120 homolog isoform X2 [Anabrus simplex]|uniref:UPF0669 protein C6orf120 homolog isoform X2 n=1 Tax=Anabrus simplex TaxID=316456 RepID=UPI0035A34741